MLGGDGFFPCAGARKNHFRVYLVTCSCLPGAPANSRVLESAGASTPGAGERLRTLRLGWKATRHARRTSSQGALARVEGPLFGATNGDVASLRYPKRKQTTCTTVKYQKILLSSPALKQGDGVVHDNRVGCRPEWASKESVGCRRWTREFKPTSSWVVFAHILDFLSVSNGDLDHSPTASQKLPV